MALWPPQSASPPQYDAESMDDRGFLTKKVQPTCNEGRDNDDYNLIVRMHDVLEHDASSYQARQRHNRREPRRYIALQLLGQGTFGQVFRCRCVETQAILAVKVIRNHPSYNKQALTEVEITQMVSFPRLSIAIGWLKSQVCWIAIAESVVYERASTAHRSH